jgi:YHS domain-containing protein
MTTYTKVVLATAMAMSAGVAAAQHAAHQMPQPPPTQTPSAQTVAACVGAQQHVTALADRANARLEAARQSNSPQELRAAIADLQTTLLEIRERATVCAALQPAQAPADHAGHGAGTPVAPAARPGATPVPAEAIDPVCSMKVDPKVAPSTAYQGKTYYFCSDADRQRFLKDPAKYIKKNGP